MHTTACKMVKAAPKKSTGKTASRKAKTATRSTPSEPTPAPSAPQPTAQEASQPTDGLTTCAQKDYLTQDEPIPGQDFVCVSFVNPAEVLPKKDAFFFDKYVEEVVTPRLDAFVAAVLEAPEKVREFADSLKESCTDTRADHDTFVANNQVRLDSEFEKACPANISTSGFKVRGAFGTIEAARKHAEHLQRTDRAVDVFVAQMGAWCPFSPRAESVGDVVYDETELNTLMKLKQEAEEHKADIYAMRKEQQAALARKEGQKGALEPVLEEEEDGVIVEEEDLDTTSQS